ncbi:MAG: cobalamin B12-binding domain-containing protein [Deltaproteobacteria bacterium]|nr:cobalamin B12-binding domain-containing protein [Deltaproteobacteria bacterium]
MNTSSAVTDSAKQKVLIATADVAERVAPLGAGYLEAFARTDPIVAANWRFEQYVCTLTKTSADSFLRALLDADADVYAFSCYVWNMGMIKKSLGPLLREKPDARVILGGPQVMHHAGRYLDPRHEGLVLCDGEGERTFKEYLAELSKAECDLTRVKGLSFYREGELITTGPQERIRDLDEIPSPYLNGYIQAGCYTNAHLETNRGCPFKCQYCYWGGAVGAKVNKMGEERVMDEITWLAENGIMFLFIVDANWGMLDRDVRLSEHIAACREKYGLPLEVAFCSSKNTPQRVSRITQIFRAAGLLSTQSIALQTMSEQALVKVSRDNIKRSTYEQLQKDLNAQGISSFIELIWPLPGETFETFQSGITQLCASGTESLLFYPLLLLNNTELDNNKYEYGLITVRTQDPYSELEHVIQSKEVSHETCIEGWRLIFSTIVLYNVRGLYTLAHYLHDQGVKPYGELFFDFAQFLKRRSDAPLARLCEEVIDISKNRFSTLGRIVHHVCHEAREAFDNLLAAFASAQPWWQDPMAQAYFEVDLINRVYVYSNTGFRPKQYRFRHLSVLNGTPDGYTVRVPADVMAPLRHILGGRATFHGNPVRVRQLHKQLPYMKTETDEHNFLYCTHKLDTIGEILPHWEDLDEPSKKATDVPLAVAAS